MAAAVGIDKIAVYFYFDVSEESKWSTESMLRSLISQLAHYKMIWLEWPCWALLSALETASRRLKNPMNALLRFWRRYKPMKCH
jgi:hypothetical protein